MAKDLFWTERFDELAGGRQAALPLPLPSEAEQAAERMRTPEHPAAANTAPLAFNSWAEAAAHDTRRIGDGSRRAAAPELARAVTPAELARAITAAIPRPRVD